MAHYGEASKRVINWIESDVTRASIFKKYYPGWDSVQAYLSHHAYLQDVIPNLIRGVLINENEATMARLLQPKE